MPVLSRSAPAVESRPVVPCVYCRRDIPASSFVFLSAARRLMSASCPSCSRRTTLTAATWRRWSGVRLPIPTHSVADLTVAGHYIPSSPRGEPIAGDFFDVVELEADRTLIAVGDVSGHGADAAERMISLRSATRALSLDGQSPTEVLARLDRLQSDGDPEDIATIWLGMYYPSTGVLRYASAGHLPPVIAGFGDRTILLSEATAPPLGTGVVGANAPVEEIFLPAGAYLVAFSDGLIERPDRDLEQQLHLLREVVERAYRQQGVGTTPQELVSAIIGELVPNAAAARDDVCVLVLRRDAPEL